MFYQNTETEINFNETNITNFILTLINDPTMFIVKRLKHINGFCGKDHTVVYLFTLTYSMFVLNQTGI